MKKITFIAWLQYHRRSELLAQHLGATMHFISYGQPGKLLQLPVRYLVQAWRTWVVLSREQPDVIFVQNPPIFCILVAFLYARIHGAQYAIDSHTGAFFPPWRWSVGLHRMLSRRALTTIVHNESQGKIVRDWGCRYCVIGFTPGDYSSAEDFPLDGQFNVAVVSSFAPDEPLHAVFEAASRLSGARFYFTGDSNRIPSALLAKKPNNCCLTGFLSYERYLGLLQGVDAIMVLTTRNHTLLMGGFEAVSLGTPLITSDWPVLKDYFPIGAIHVPNTAEGIYEGVRQAQVGHDTLKRDILRLRDRLQNEWEKRFEELQRLIAKG